MTPTEPADPPPPDPPTPLPNPEWEVPYESEPLRRGEDLDVEFG
jgi:hypothetical protein